jgi:hypothetical protein
MFQVVVSEEIREQFPVLEDRVDRVSQKSGLAAKRSYRLPIRWLVVPNLEVLGLKRLKSHAGDLTLNLKMETTDFGKDAK